MHVAHAMLTLMPCGTEQEENLTAAPNACSSSMLTLMPCATDAERQPGNSPPMHVSRAMLTLMSCGYTALLTG